MPLLVLTNDNIGYLDVVHQRSGQLGTFLDGLGTLWVYVLCSRHCSIDGCRTNTMQTRVVYGPAVDNERQRKTWSSHAIYAKPNAVFSQPSYSLWLRLMDCVKNNYVMCRQAVLSVELDNEWPRQTPSPSFSSFSFIPVRTPFSYITFFARLIFVDRHKAV